MGVIVLGGTGQVGRNAVKASVMLKEYSMVIEDGRRFLNLSPSPKRTARQCDFEALQPVDIQSTKADTILIALGTNRKNARSAEVFKKVDQDYVINFAKAARNQDIAQRLVYCSSWGANPSSSGLYLKSKGETEQKLSGLGYETIICRPAYLTEVDRAKKPYEFIAPFFMAVLSVFGVSSTITVAQVGEAMAKAGVLGIQGLRDKQLGEQKGNALYLYNSHLLQLADTPL